MTVAAESGFGMKVVQEEEIMSVLRLASAAALAMLIAGPLSAADTARAEISGPDGNSLGGVTVQNTPSGKVMVTVTLSGLPPGVHATHFHETGDCSAPDFSSAGEHIAAGMEHGVLSEGGPHPGDLPNLTVAQSGAGEAEYFVTGLDIDGDLLDSDGAAFVVHDGVDDYQSQPSGDSGDRIACGAFSGE
jgi:Cu-Zn family superoxide dismutase